MGGSWRTCAASRGAHDLGQLPDRAGGHPRQQDAVAADHARIIIGVAAVIAVVSIVQGLNYVIATQLEGVGAAYIRVHWREDETNPDLAGREVVLTYEDGLAIFERATALEYFNPIFFRGEQLRFSDQRHATTMLGVGAFHQEVNNHWVERGLLLPARPRPPGPGLHHRPRHHRRARARRRPWARRSSSARPPSPWLA
jgi:hypothetical protein